MNESQKTLTVEDAAAMGYLRPDLEMPAPTPAQGLPYDVPLSRPRLLSRKAERSQYSKSALFAKVDEAREAAGQAAQRAVEVTEIAKEMAEHFKAMTTASVKAIHEDRENALLAIQASLDEASRQGALLHDARWRAEKLGRRLVVLLTLGAVQTLGTIAWWLVSR